MKKSILFIGIVAILNLTAQHSGSKDQFTPNNQTYPYGVMIHSALKNIQHNTDIIAQHISKNDNPMPWVTRAITIAENELESVATAYLTTE